MYGTVARMRIKEGHFDQVKAMSEEWNEHRRNEDTGFLGQYVFRLDEDPNEYMLVVLFKDREYYHRNAQNPEQNDWFQQLMVHFDSEPSWMDGEVVHSIPVEPAPQSM